MKINIRKKVFSSLVLGMALLLGSTSVYGQIKQEKKVNKTFSGKEVVKIIHAHGPINIKKSNSNEVRVNVILSLEAKTDEDAKIALDNFEVNIDDFDNRLSIKTLTNIENWVTKNNVSKLTFKNGEKVKGIKNINVSFDIYLPNLRELYVASKYDKVNIEDGIKGDVELKIYSGRINAGKINGDLKLDMKYTKGDIGDFQNGDFDLYDCNLDLGNGENVVLESKYSEIELGDCNELELEVYDDSFEIGNIKGNLSIIDKYSDFKIGSFGNARMDLYDSNISLKKGEAIQLKSKYTEFNIDELKNLNFDLSYDDIVRVGKLGSLVTDSKYTQYDIEVLSNGIKMETYDDDVKVAKFIGPLKDSEIEGKYTEVSFNIPKETKFRLDAAYTYGKLEFEKSQFEIQREDLSSTRKEIKGQHKGATSNSPLIQLDLYDCKVDLN